MPKNVANGGKNVAMTQNYMPLQHFLIYLFVNNYTFAPENFNRIIVLRNTHVRNFVCYLG